MANLNYWNTGINSVAWSGTTGSSGSWNWNVQQAPYHVTAYQQYYIDDQGSVKPRSDAQQIIEGWDGDQNPA